MALKMMSSVVLNGSHDFRMMYIFNIDYIRAPTIRPANSLWNAQAL